MNNTQFTYRDKLVISILSCILLAVLSYRLFISPDLQKMNTLQMEYDTAKMTFELLSEKADNINSENPDEKMKESINNLSEISKNVIPLGHSEYIANDLWTVFDNNNLNTETCNVEEPVIFSAYDSDEQLVFESSYIYVSKISISSSGRIRDIMNLIDTINSYNCYAIENFNITDNTDNTVSFDITLNIFMYDDSLINSEG